MEKVYLALWCHCVYESAFTPLSIHRTRMGAYRAIRKQIRDEWECFRNDIAAGVFDEDDIPEKPYGLTHTAWKVEEKEVLD